MLFNSYLFILVFLPAAMAGFFLMARLGGKTVAQTWLVVVSLAFYSWDNPSVLLPLILYPIWVPVLIASVQLTGLALTGRSWGEGANWLTLVVVYDLLFLGAGLILFDQLLEE